MKNDPVDAFLRGVSLPFDLLAADELPIRLRKIVPHSVREHMFRLFADGQAVTCDLERAAERATVAGRAARREIT
jgi:hypothetical protein